MWFMQVSKLAYLIQRQSFYGTDIQLMGWVMSDGAELLGSTSVPGSSDLRVGNVHA
jgi:hypothetical protein